MSAHPDLFLPPPVPTISKKRLNRIRRGYRNEIEHWAEHVLSRDLIVAYCDAENTWTYINVTGSGPPENWRKLVLDGLFSDYGDAELPTAFLHEATNPQLVKAAIRIGRLSRSIIQTMPPKPAELS